MGRLPALIKTGQSIVEIMIVLGLSVVILPTIYLGLMSARQNRVMQSQRTIAWGLLKESVEAARTFREADWTTFAVNGTYHPEISGSTWILSPGADPAPVNGFIRSILISDVYRDASGLIIDPTAPGAVIDTATKKVDFTVSWSAPYATQLTSSRYLTRYMDNLAFLQTTQTDFNTGLLSNTAVTNTAGGEITLAANTKAKWCSPDFASSTIDLPDGPPVAVDAKPGSTASVPNDVFVITSPQTSSTIKLANVTVSADTDPPVSSLRGIFTLNSGSYSNPSYVPAGLDLDNSFKTNDVKYFTTSTDSNTGYFSPSANSVDTGGDNNGFQSYPTRVYSDDSSFAVDTNSGNGTGTSCTGSDKDKHQYYNYGLSLPGGVVITGFEVRLDARVDSTNGSPKICTQLSWDGGTTWTTAKSTSTLTTSQATYLLGGSSDTWGRAWTADDLTNTNFRLRIINVAGNTSRDFSLDWAGIKIYYQSPTAQTYALISTNKPDKEIIAVLVNDGDPTNDTDTTGEYADPVNKIFKYWTYFNTRIYTGTSSNDQAPFDYGGTTLTVLNDRGYVASGGYLYVFDLGNIQTKSPGSALDQIGCRIQLDGYDCSPGTGTDRKYSSGQTGTTWSDTTSPAHLDCSDGGNIELYATNDLYPVQVSGHNYIYVAVGAGTNPEFDLVDATNVPDAGSSPSISSTSCGRISGGNSGWKLIGNYDFNSNSGTEEAANSVFAKSDGTRAYISSNGTTDSKQFYILNTSNKSSPAFLSGSSSSGPSSGYYQGTGANGEMYPRRSLTVLNGQRVVLVGKDGVTNGFDAQEYQVLNSQDEAVPAYCGGINFDQGFNDLTSVSEADTDNFVYMVANTQVNELKIIQGGPDGYYNESGVYESQIVDGSHPVYLIRLTANSALPAGTSLTFQVAAADPVSGSCADVVYTYIGPDGTSSSYFPSSGGQIPISDDGTGFENPAQCFRYKAYLSTTDFNATPVVYDTLINYSP